MKELPKKWAIQTENEEFYKWANIYHRKEREPILRWCVRRTQENAEVLQAWRKATFSEKQYWSKYGDTDLDYLHSVSGIVWDSIREGYTEITFEQWQTIPEVAEWIYVNCQFFWDMNAAKRVLKLKPSCKINTEKLQEREIIGYEAPRDLFGKRIKAGTVFTKCKITTVSFEYIHGQTILPAEIVETWKPVYAKPVFKVGDWVTFEDLPTKKTFNIDEIDPITEFDGTQRVISAGINYSAKCCRLATPEEIEAARPKRKYMKQVWYVLVMDENFNSLLVSKQHETEEEAHQWELENSEEGKVYSVKPFEVLAYE